MDSPTKDLDKGINNVISSQDSFLQIETILIFLIHLDTQKVQYKGLESPSAANAPCSSLDF